MHRFCLVLSLVASQFLASTSARSETAIFDGNAVTIIETAGSAVDFYRTNGNRNIAPVPLNNNGFNVFFHKDTTTDMYSIGFVIDNNNDGTGGRVQGTISGLNTGSFVALADDNPSEFSMPTANTAVFNFRWISRWTDGGVISGIDINNLNLSINITSASGLTDFHVLDAGGTQFSLGVIPAAGTSLTIVGSAPEPSTWAFMIMGFCVTALRLKYLKRRSSANIYADSGSLPPSQFCKLAQ